MARKRIKLGTATITADTTGYDVLSGLNTVDISDLGPDYRLECKTSNAGTAPGSLTFDAKLQHAIEDTAALFADASIAITQITAVGNQQSAGVHATSGTTLYPKVQVVVQASSSGWNGGTTCEFWISGAYNR